jgi:hypothetical protein
MLDPLATFGLATVTQAVPFQFSVSVWIVDVPGTKS